MIVGGIGGAVVGVGAWLTVASTRPDGLSNFMVNTGKWTPWGGDKMTAIFSDGVFKCIFLNEAVWISIKSPPKFVPKGPIANILVLVSDNGLAPLLGLNELR